MKRNTTLRDKHRRQIAADKPPCHICGEVIDYALPYLHPMSFVVDHVMPLARGGADALASCWAAHRQRACNRTKGDRLAGETNLIRRSRSLRRPFETDRQW